MRFIIRKLNDCSGAALIEAAIVFPLFIMMSFATLAFVIVMFQSFVLESAMFEATRLAKVSPNTEATVAAIRQTIQDRSFGLLNPDDVIITTDLQINFALNWKNTPAEKCAPPDTGTCPCPGPHIDDNGNGLCDIGPPPLELESPGSLVDFAAFYKSSIITPYLSSLANLPDGRHLISSSTVVRNER